MVVDTSSISAAAAPARRAVAVPLLAALTLCLLAAGLLAMGAPSGAVLASCGGLGWLLWLRERLAPRDLHADS